MNKGSPYDKIITDNPFEDLCIAVIMQTIDDWKHAKNYLRKHENSTNKETQKRCNLARKDLYEIETFMKSGDWMLFSELDGGVLWETLNKGNLHLPMQTLFYK